MLDRLAASIDRGMQIISDLLHAPVSGYCRLETVDGNALVADDGSLISVLRLEGSLKHVGVAEYNNIVSVLTEKLQSSLSRPGHVIQCVFEYDPDGSARRIDELLRPSRLTARGLGLHIDTLLDDWSEALRTHCASESCFLIIWTRPNAMENNLRKTAVAERRLAMSSVPNLPGCQNVCAALAGLRDAHNGFLAGVLDAFRQADLLLHELSPHEALRDIRLCIDPAFTSDQWQALIPGDPLPLRYPDPDAPERDRLQRVVYPDFRHQLWPREGKALSRSTLRIGDRVFGPLIMTLMPQTPKPFQEFFRTIAYREGGRLPYRISFLLADGGLYLGLKPLLASILAFTSSDNRRFNRAVDDLRAMDLEGTCCVRFSICLCTWADGPEEAAHELLRRRMAELAKAVQGWGTTDVSEAVGDPLLGFTATVPAMMSTSPAPVTAAPLPAALGMLPLRPASPWKDGSLLLRTRDGKVFPFAPHSSEQAAWIDLGVAPMGAGKSVFLNAMNFAFVMQAGLTRLPWVSIVDVGPSSSGLITLLRANLPEGKKHLAAYHRLRMTEAHAINPFDTPLGLRRPLPSHKTFLVNFLSLLATPHNADAPADGVPEMLGRAIDLAYDTLADGRQSRPRPYQANTLPELHELLSREGMVMDSRTTWWEVVDFLFEHDHIHQAWLAQRYAVPLLADISAQISQNPGIEALYDATTRNNVRRSIVDAIEAYVILKGPTRFELGDAQVVSLDLDEVAPRGTATADRQSAVMYMLARHVLGSRFFLMPDDVKLMPPLYQRYHAERIEAIREDPKRLCYDEAHRVTRNMSVAGQLLADMTTMSRESRKWNLSLGLYSQSIDDMPEIICEQATSVLILGGGTEAACDAICARFGFNGACRHALSRLGKPGPAGANLIAQFRTGKGNSQLPLTLTIGPQSLWAFSTTTEDVAIRNALYRHLPPSEALRRLARRFPGGSAKSEVERRRRLVADQSGEELTNVIHEITGELLDISKDKTESQKN